LGKIMPFEVRPNVSIAVAIASIAASALLAWVGYKSGLENLAGPRSGMTGAARDDYLQGSIAGAFLLPCVISLFALVPKGRTTRRVLIVYSVAAVILSLTTLLTFH
jgi:hypothetical protein